MAGQLIKNAPILGRIGESLGKGLSEVVPKEAERYRLSQGLKQFEKEASGLNPVQQYSRLLPLLKDYPAALQAFPEILKNQSYRQALANRGGAQRAGGVYTGSEPMSPVAESNYINQLKEQAGNPDQNQQRRPSEIVTPGESGQPQVTPNNPTRPEALPGRPFTQERWLDEMDDASRLFPNASPEEISKFVADKEQRYLAQPKYQQEYDNYLNEKRAEIKKEFKDEKERHLQKFGSETFQDISGDLESDMERTIERDIKANPRASVPDVVKKRVSQLLSFAKTRNDFDDYATKGISNFLTPGKRQANWDKLNSFASTYNDLNRNEEFFEKLTTHTSPKGFGLGLSPVKAASIAYNVKNVPGFDKYLNSLNSKQVRTVFDSDAESIAQAINIEPFLRDPKASLLSIMNSLKQNLGNMNENAFLNQIREDRDSGRITLSPFQDRELHIGESEIFPNWADLLYSPVYPRK